MSLRGVDPDIISAWNDSSSDKANTFAKLSVKITELIKKLPQKLVLLIDEVDKAGNFDVFLLFLGLLRNKYLARDLSDIPTFQSVILAGVYDIRNLKLKLRPDEMHQYNSPWNIASDFEVDMSFNPAEIATMLQDYENDQHTGMDIPAISAEIHRFTNGYPYLVSAVCKIIDEKLNNEAYDRLCGYLDSRRQEKGYLLNFCFNKNADNLKELNTGWFNHNKKQIFAETVVFSS